MTTQQKQDEKPKEEIAYKWSNRGQGELLECTIIEGKPYFMKYYSNKEKNKQFITIQDKIEGMGLVLRPPTKQECPFEPYEFKTLDEPQKYLMLAMEETPDSLLAQIKVQVKQFNDISDKTATLLSSYIFGSYFQDRFSTVRYICVVGANGTGKSAFGDTFECLAYRVVNVTNTTSAFWFRVFGTLEYGQVTIIVEEFDKMDENSEIMAMIKAGYQPNAKVPRMNSDSTKMEFFYPFGLKIMISEKSPNEDKARGVLDRTFKIKTNKGYPKYNIKEIRNPQGNPERQRRIEEMNHLRKLLLAYRLLHIKDPYKEVDIGLDGRDEELCKPLLQLSYTLEAKEETQTEIERTLQYFIDTKNNRKGDSLEASIYEPVTNTVNQLGKEYISLSQEDPTEKLKSVSSTDIWTSITKSLDGEFGTKNDGTENNQVFYSEEFGRLYRSWVIGIVRDKFNGVKDHKEKGNNLIFNLDNLNKLKRIYENDGRIKTVPKDPDSLIHSDDFKGRGLSESGGNNDQKQESDEVKQESKEVKETDSQGRGTPQSGFSESVSQVNECPYCNEKIDPNPYCARIHRENCDKRP